MRTCPLLRGCRSLRPCCWACDARGTACQREMSAFPGDQAGYDRRGLRTVYESDGSPGRTGNHAITSGNSGCIQRCIEGQSAIGRAAPFTGGAPGIVGRRRSTVIVRTPSPVGQRGETLGEDLLARSVRTIRRTRSFVAPLMLVLSRVGGVDSEFDRIIRRHNLNAARPPRIGRARPAEHIGLG